MHYKDNKHVFAFIEPEEHYLESFKEQSQAIIAHKELSHRLHHIVRLQPTEHFILFNRTYHLECRIDEITKKHIAIFVIAKHKNEIVRPEIICAVPLLKRDALEQVVEGITQLGATHIQLITTHKAHRKSLDTKEIERLQRIIYAAAEQSKNFSYPLINTLQTLDTFFTSYSTSYPVFLDPQGASSWSSMQTIKRIEPSSLLLIVGPEGDLTEEEKSLLKKNNTHFMALTPTILRAEQALITGLGILRSLLR